MNHQQVIPVIFSLINSGLLTFLKGKFSFIIILCLNPILNIQLLLSYRSSSKIIINFNVILILIFVVIVYHP